MVGPTRHGVEDLIGANPDVYLVPGQYQSSGGTVSDTSRSLLVVPIWDVCNSPDFECPGNNFPSGTDVTIPVAGFALIFIEGIQDNDVLARLIGVLPCTGPPGAGPAPPETGPFAIPLRLIRPT